MPEIYALFNTTAVAGAVSMIFLQSSREIFMRCLGLFVIFLSTLSNFVLSGQSNYIYLLVSFILLILGVLSDYYSPVIRNWYLFVPYSNFKPTIYCIFIALITFPIALGLDASHSLIIGTFLGSIIADLINPRVRKNPKEMVKAAVGSIGGFYGMATKFIIALQMVDIFLWMR